MGLFRNFPHQISVLCPQNTNISARKQKYFARKNDWGPNIKFLGASRASGPGAIPPPPPPLGGPCSEPSILRSPNQHWKFQLVARLQIRRSLAGPLSDNQTCIKSAVHNSQHVCGRQLATDLILSSRSK